MATKIGAGCKAYRNTGTWASPTWSEIKCISDMNQTFAFDAVDASTRESLVKFSEKTQVEYSWTFKVQKGNVTDATNLAALMAAIPSQSSVLDLMILDGSSTSNGTVGWRGQVKLYSANEDQSLGTVLYPEIMAKPCPPTVAGQIPQSVLVSGGSAAFTDIAA